MHFAVEGLTIPFITVKYFNISVLVKRNFFEQTPKTTS
jgi:hypothetical protein